MNKIIVVAGPTASGKTDLGRIIAEKYNGVVVSVDSRQIYRELDLGTGKDKTFHQEMIDIINPPTGVYPVNTLEVITGYTPVFSVNKFQKYGLAVIKIIHNQGKIPVLVGGTGYYLESILFDIQYPDISNKKIVRALEEFTTEELYQQLNKLDPVSALRSQMNRRKLIRSLEIVKTTGKIVPKLQRNKRFNYLLIVLDPGNQIVNKNIETRLNSRLEQGLVKEVKKLRAKYNHNWLSNLGLEYRHISDFLDEKIDEVEMKVTLISAIRSYARRQRTWFRRYKDANWVSNYIESEKLISDFLK